MSCRLGEHGPQPLGVVQGAQQMHAGHALGPGQPHGFGAGGEDQDVVRHDPGLGVQFVRVGAHAQRLAAKQQFDVEGLEVHVEGGALGLAQQDRLGERRTVVRLMRLRADHRDGALEALFAQRDRGLHAGFMPAPTTTTRRCACVCSVI